jgi:RNA polymerase-binding transcription factor
MDRPLPPLPRGNGSLQHIVLQSIPHLSVSAADRGIFATPFEMSDAIEGGTMTSNTKRRARTSSSLGVRRKVRAVSRKTKAKLDRVAQAAPTMQQVQATATVMAENLQAILQNLLVEMQRIKAEIAEHARLAQERADSGNDVGDDATQIAEVSKNLALKRHLERLLTQIEAAVRRIEEGVYGVCERCGQAIHPERLQVLPYVTTCVSCARAAA